MPSDGLPDGLPGASNHASNMFDGDGFFGPKEVYDSEALKGMLKGFDRRAGVDNATWLRQYAYTTTGPDGKVEKHVHWPNDSTKGFAVNSDGISINSRSKIAVGTLIDRFGHDSDSPYFAPFGTPFAARAIPANVLFLPYNAYEVVKELEVDQGPIAPGFGQPGMGIQYIVPKKTIKDSNGKDVEVVQTPAVLTPDYLRRLTTKQIEDLYVQLYTGSTGQ